MPQIESISTTAVAVKWFEPRFTGGCPITTYHLYLAGADEQDIFAEVERLSIINQPFLTSYAFDSSSLDVGSRYRVRVGAENHIGESLSDSVGFLLANIPSQPDPPTRESNGLIFTILMTPPDEDGGSIVNNY